MARGVRGGRDGQRDGRRGRDRELARRHDPRDVRPAARSSTTGIRIVGEVERAGPARPRRAARPAIDWIERVYSHAQALAQADEFLRGPRLAGPDDLQHGRRRADDRRAARAAARRRSRRRGWPRLYGLEILADEHPDRRRQPDPVRGPGPRRTPLPELRRPTARPARRRRSSSPSATCPGSLHRCLGAFATAASTSRASSRGPARTAPLGVRLLGRPRRRRRRAGLRRRASTSSGRRPRWSGSSARIRARRERLKSADQCVSGRDVRDPRLAPGRLTSRRGCARSAGDPMHLPTFRHGWSRRRRTCARWSAALVGTERRPALARRPIDGSAAPGTIGRSPTATTAAVRPDAPGRRPRPTGRHGQVRRSDDQARAARPDGSAGATAAEGVTAAALPPARRMPITGNPPARQPVRRARSRAAAGDGRSSRPIRASRSGPDHVDPGRQHDASGSSTRTGQRWSTTVDLVDFFSCPPRLRAFVFDPRVIYDSLHGAGSRPRSSCDCHPGGGQTRHRLHRRRRLATADPTGDWLVRSLPFTRRPAGLSRPRHVDRQGRLRAPTRSSSSPADVLGCDGGAYSAPTMLVSTGRSSLGTVGRSTSYTIALFRRRCILPVGRRSRRRPRRRRCTSSIQSNGRRRHDEPSICVSPATAATNTVDAVGDQSTSPQPMASRLLGRSAASAAARAPRSVTTASTPARPSRSGRTTSSPSCRLGCTPAGDRRDA